MSNRLGGKQGTSYLGTNANQPPNWTFEPRDPNQYDTQNVVLGDLWMNTDNKTAWILVSLEGDMQSKGALATWRDLEGGGGGGSLDTLTGDTGGAIPSDVNENINIVSNITGLSFDGNAGTNTITLNSTGGTGPMVQTATGNTGGAVSPLLGNINIVGDGVGITITGNPGSHTLTASLIGGGAPAESFPTDAGTAIPIAGVLTIKADTAIKHAGSTVGFSGISNNVQLDVSDSDLNTIIGGSSGNVTMTGQSNTVLGHNSALALTTANHNVMIGTQTAQNLTTGTYNILLGHGAGALYTTSESSNIILGGQAVGTAAESHVLRIGSGAGTGTGQLNKAFIHGIRGITPGAGNGIPVYVDSNGQLGTVGTGGSGTLNTLTGNTGGAVSGLAGNINVVGDGTSITITGNPGTNTLTASLVGGGIGAQSFDGDTGTAVPSAGDMNVVANTSSQHAGSSVSFSASGNTILFNVTDSDDNTIIGEGSGNAGISGSNNTVLGSSSALQLTVGDENTVVGSLSASSMNSASGNTVVGYNSGNSLTTGQRNIFIGSATANAYTTSESDNITIGYLNPGTAGESHILRIANGTGSSNGQINKAFISGIRGITPDAGNGIPVYVDSNGQLGTVGTGGGGGLTSMPTDSGTATESGGAITLKAGLSSQRCGSTVSFSASSNNILMNVTNANTNTIMGLNSGNATVSGLFNTAFGGSSAVNLSSGNSNSVFGSLSASLITTGGLNTVVGSASATSLTTGSRNTIVGTSSGSNYASSESNNILLGNGVTGTAAESNTCRIGNATGSSASQLNKTFIHGIRGITPGAGNGIPVYVDSNGQLGTVGTPFSSPPAFLVTLSTIYNVPSTGGTVPYDNIIYDNTSSFNVGTRSYIAPLTGLYHFSSNTGMQYSNPGGPAGIAVGVGTTNKTFYTQQLLINNVGFGPAPSLVLSSSTYVYLAAGDFVRIDINPFNFNALNLTPDSPLGNTQTYNNFSGSFISS